MSLFRKRRDDEEPANGETEEPADGPVASTAHESVSPAGPTTGPFDVADVVDDRPRIDLGSVRVPAVDGMEVRVETDGEGRVMNVGLVVRGNVLQVQAFAAPRTEGIWDEIRTELHDSLTAQGGTVEEQTGRFGPELRARVSVERPDGSTGPEDLRFLGVDGPRWFLRGVVSGAAPTDPARATVVEDMFAGVVVVRGDQAAPPREPLPLTLPEGPGLARTEETPL